MNQCNLPLNCWAAEDLPSNKGVSNGFGSLTIAELLSIVIGNGTKDSNAIEIARLVLYKGGNSLKGLARLRLEELASVKGVGKVKATRIKACMSLCARMANEPAPNKEKLSSAQDVYQLFWGKLALLDHEEFWVVYLNQQLGIIKYSKIGQGGLADTSADIRIIMREALLSNAVAICCIHNHPSGGLNPSRTDDELTLRIRKAAEMLRLQLTDHVIVADGGYYSYKESGKL